MKIRGYWGKFDAPYVKVRLALLTDKRQNLVLITDEVLTV